MVVEGLIDLMLREYLCFGNIEKTTSYTNPSINLDVFVHQEAVVAG